MCLMVVAQTYLVKFLFILFLRLTKIDFNIVFIETKNFVNKELKL